MAVGLPARVGRYRVEALLGAGGFATVYRAYDERLDATVAVKVLAENHSHDPDMRERFLKEGQVLRRIDGSHVVTVHDLGETDQGQPYLVLEHADRGNLADRVADRRAAGWVAQAADVRHVVDVVGDALGAVHASGLVHRDVAPRNLLLRSVREAGTHARCGLVATDERLLLADLGLSKDLATASGLTVGAGTIGFTPPEQRNGLTTVDARADLWAASALVVWLVLGESPDDGGRWRAGLRDCRWSGPVVDALASGLSPDPKDRPASAGEWHAALRAALAPPPPPQPRRPANDVDGSSSVSRRRGRRRGALIALVAVVLGAGLGAGAQWLLRGDPDLELGSEQTTDDLGDGQVRVEASGDGASVAIVGPSEIGVGEAATFDSDVDGVASVVWYGPDGQVHTSVEQLTVEASSPGLAVVTLVGVGADGRSVTATHVVEVVEES